MCKIAREDGAHEEGAQGNEKGGDATEPERQEREVYPARSVSQKMMTKRGELSNGNNVSC